MCGWEARDLKELLERRWAGLDEEEFEAEVRRIAAENGALEVDWREPVEPRLLPAGQVEVECHLYDESALAEAARRRESAIPE